MNEVGEGDCNCSDATDMKNVMTEIMTHASTYDDVYPTSCITNTHTICDNNDQKYKLNYLRVINMSYVIFGCSICGILGLVTIGASYVSFYMLQLYLSMLLFFLKYVLFELRYLRENPVTSDIPKTLEEYELVYRTWLRDVGVDEECGDFYQHTSALDFVRTMCVYGASVETSNTPTSTFIENETSADEAPASSMKLGCNVLKSVNETCVDENASILGDAKAQVFSPSKEECNESEHFKTESSTSSNVDWIHVGKRIGKSILDQKTAQMMKDSDNNNETHQEALTPDDKNRSVQAKPPLTPSFVTKDSILGQNSSFSLKQTPVKPSHPMWVNNVDNSLVVSPDVFERNESFSSNDDTNGCDNEDAQGLSPNANEGSLQLPNASIFDDTSARDPLISLDSKKDDMTKDSFHKDFGSSPSNKTPLKETLVKVVASNALTSSDNISEGTMSNSSFYAQSLLSGFDRCSILSGSRHSGNFTELTSKNNIDLKLRLRSAFSSKKKARNVQEPSIELELNQPELPSLNCTSNRHSNAIHNIFFKRKPLLPGTKIVVPLFSPIGRKSISSGPHQIATIADCQRIYVPSKWKQKIKNHSFEYNHRPNCLELKVYLDKAYLRNGAFVQLTMRILDGMKMPRHSALPIGSCVLTKFGVGILVAWRVIDDIHVIRSLWNRRGSGSAIAYLRRDAIIRVMPAAIGFEVETSRGKGFTTGYVNGAFLINFSKDMGDSIISIINESDIISCPVATFIPICEQIKEAALYQIQCDEYQIALHDLDNYSIDTAIFLWVENLELILNGILFTLEENTNIDAELASIINFIISFVEQMGDNRNTFDNDSGDNKSEICSDTDSALLRSGNEPDGFWFLNDAFGGILRRNDNTKVGDTTMLCKSYRHYATTFLRIMKRAISFAIIEGRACGKADFVMGLRITYEVLFLVEAMIKIRRKNATKTIEEMREKTLKKIHNILAPFNERVVRVGRGIIDRMQSQGKKAWIKVNNLIVALVSDDEFFTLIECQEWNSLVNLFMKAVVSSKLMNEKSCLKLYEGVKAAFSAFILKGSNTEVIQANYETEVAFLTFVFKWFTKVLATPRRTILKTLASNEFQEVCERIFVRVFKNNVSISSSLNIYASSFRTLRELRILKDINIAGSIWVKILEAANEELFWIVSQLPPNIRDCGVIISKLLTLGVMHFHLLVSGQVANWYSFLFESEAAELIQKLDIKVIELVEYFCEDLQNAICAMPYYERIDEDFLAFLDGVDVENVMKEAVTAITDGEDFTAYLREKSENALDHILAYLPKMHIPVEKRDIGDGWLLTCRGKNGQEPLQLSSVQLKRDNLVCKVLGSGNLLGPLGVTPNQTSVTTKKRASQENERENITHNSILNNICDLLLNASKHNCWVEGYGGVGVIPSNPSVARLLRNLPISSVLNSAIELWEDMEIDDDELMEIAIRDVSFQIKLHGEDEKLKPKKQLSRSSTKVEHTKRLFNPRKDPTLLYLKLTGLTFDLNDFSFRLEPKESYSQLSPVFEGSGTLSIQEALIIVRVECYKERNTNKSERSYYPVLRLRDYEFDLDGIDLRFQETGFDWFLNYAISGFREIISDLLSQNMRDQVHQQIRDSLSQVNELFMNNPDFVLGLLRIHIDDLEEDTPVLCN